MEAENLFVVSSTFSTKENINKCIQEVQTVLPTFSGLGRQRHIYFFPPVRLSKAPSEAVVYFFGCVWVLFLHYCVIFPQLYNFIHFSMASHGDREELLLPYPVSLDEALWHWSYPVCHGILSFILNSFSNPITTELKGHWMVTRHLGRKKPMLSHYPSPPCKPNHLFWEWKEPTQILPFLINTFCFDCCSLTC